MQQILLVQEFAKSGYWLPGGRVDAGEDLARAAERETLEEAGVALLGWEIRCELGMYPFWCLVESGAVRGI